MKNFFVFVMAWLGRRDTSAGSVSLGGSRTSWGGLVPNRVGNDVIE